MYFFIKQENNQAECPKPRRYSPVLESAQFPDKNFPPGEWRAVPDIWKSVAEKFGDEVAVVDPYHEPPSRMTYKEVDFVKHLIQYQLLLIYCAAF